MVRSYSRLLGVGLLILWIAGLVVAGASSWLTWVDGAAALLAFMIGSSGKTPVPRTMMAGSMAIRQPPSAERSGAAILLSLGLFAAWAIGLWYTTRVWIDWATFGFACAFLLLGVIGGARRSSSSDMRPPGDIHLPPADESEEPFRRTG